MMSTALHTASLFGNGLSGVDLKVTRRGVFVIEVNLNPSIEASVEDAHLKDELYTHPHRIRAPHRGSAGGLRWGVGVEGTVWKRTGVPSFLSDSD